MESSSPAFSRRLRTSDKVGNINSDQLSSVVEVDTNTSNEPSVTFEPQTTEGVVDTNSAMAYNFEGVKAYKQNNIEKAVEFFTKAIELDGELVYPYYNRAHMYILLSPLRDPVKSKLPMALDDATSYCARTLQSSKENPEAFELVVKVYLKMGRVEEASAHVEEGLKKYPHNYNLNYYKKEIKMCNEFSLPDSVNKLDQLSKRYRIPEVELALVLSNCSLQLRRDMNTCRIVLLGITGAGKSTTCNMFFDAPICEVSSSQSKTSSVNEYSVTLKHHDYPRLSFQLNVVDTPGFFDTTGLEMRNNVALWKYCLKRINSKPNILWLVFDVSQNRFEGNESQFTCMLRDIAASYDVLIDHEHPNVIIIATHAASLGTVAEIFKSNWEQKKAKIREIVEKELNISDVPIVMVENSPEQFAWPKKGDFHVAPDGTKIPANLFRAMDALLDKNGDELGRVAINHYYSTVGKGLASEPVLVYQTTEVNQKDIKGFYNQAKMKGRHALGATVNLGNPLMKKEEVPAVKPRSSSVTVEPITVVAPFLELSSLGNGYNIRSGTIADRKVLELLDNLPKQPEGKTITYNKTTYSLPKEVDYRPDENVEVLVQDEANLESYRKRMAARAGVAFIPGVFAEASFGLGGGKGTQISAGTRAMNFSVVYTRFWLSLSTSDHYALSFKQYVALLPTTFDPENSDIVRKFKTFINYFGTHYISSAFYGGTIEGKCSVTSTNEQHSTEAHIESVVKAAIGRIGIGFDGGIEYTNSSIESSGVAFSSFNCKPPYRSPLTKLDKGSFDRWCDSLKQHPAQLTQTFKLQPITSLLITLAPEKVDALEKAVESYIQGEPCMVGVQHPIERRDTTTTIPPPSPGQEVTLRDEQFKASNASSAAKTGAKGCFPGSAFVMHATRGWIPISDVQIGDNIMCYTVHGTAYSKVYAFMHADSKEVAEYINVHYVTSSQVSGVLRISDKHLLFVKNSQNKSRAIFADEVKPGDKLLYSNTSFEGSLPEAVVVHTSTTKETGVFAPITEAGTMIVNNIATSCFAHTHSHNIAQIAFVPLRLWRSFIGHNKYSREEFSGIHWYGRTLANLFPWMTS